MMSDRTVIMKAVAYIEDHLDDKLTLDDVAASVGYSKFHLSRMFAEDVGCTLHKYMQTRRLTRAAAQLVHTTRPIVEIASDANYESQQAFTLAFRQLYFCTPQKYRLRGVHTPKLDRFTMKREGRAA